MISFEKLYINIIGQIDWRMYECEREKGEDLGGGEGKDKLCDYIIIEK